MSTNDPRPSPYEHELTAQPSSSVFTVPARLCATCGHDDSICGTAHDRRLEGVMEPREECWLP